MTPVYSAICQPAYYQTYCRPFVGGVAPRPLAPSAGQLTTSPVQQLQRPHRRLPSTANRTSGSTESSFKSSGQNAQRMVAGEGHLGELDEIIKLVQLLPPSVKDELESHPQLLQLVEVVMDLGRPPVARFPSGDSKLSSQPITEEDLQLAVEKVGEFGGDNRAGIDKTLHRISCIRNRAGRIVGLTCRVGRAIAGSAAMVDDLIKRSSSILLLGRPGVGKTTAIREISRQLANEYSKRVVIVDTSNEIGGDGDIPHPGIGNARRMQVPHPEQQHRVMIEAVENHMPEVIVIDEIGTEAEALAARTIAQRGVQLVATAHGNELENVIKNPSLNDLVGGISSVTLGDEEAKRRGVQKSILERAGPPTFDVAVEMVSREQWRVHLDVGRAVDRMLGGKDTEVEVRERDADGKVWAWPEGAATHGKEEDRGGEVGEGSSYLREGSSSSSSSSSRRRGSPRQRQGTAPGAAAALDAAEAAAAAAGEGEWGRWGAGAEGETHPMLASIREARRALTNPSLGTFAAAHQEAAGWRGSRALGRGAAEAVAGTRCEKQLPEGSSATAAAGVVAGSESDAVGSVPSGRGVGAGAGTGGDGASAPAGAGPSGRGSGTGVLRLYAYGVDEGSISSVGGALRVEGRVQLSRRLEEADAVLALRPKLKNSPWVKEAARATGIPVFAIKSAGVGDVAKALRALLGIDPSPGSLFSSSDTAVPAGGGRTSRKVEASLAALAAAAEGRVAGGGKSSRRRGSPPIGVAPVGAVGERDALEEARLAVEQIVIPSGQPIELLPRDAAVLEAQVQLLLGYRLPFEVVGAAGNQRLRVLPPGYGVTASTAGGADVDTGR